MPLDHSRGIVFAPKRFFKNIFLFACMYQIRYLIFTSSNHTKEIQTMKNAKQYQFETINEVINHAFKTGKISRILSMQLLNLVQCGAASIAAVHVGKKMPYTINGDFYIVPA